MVWTRFMDMHSGGGTKEPPYEYIYIEAPENEAKVIFYNRFGHNPERVSCTCCGDDYSISEEKSLEQATAYERNCDSSYFRPDGTECDQNEAWVSGKGTKKGYWFGYIERQEPRKMDIRGRCNTKDSDSWGLYVPLNKYLSSDGVLVIRSDDIKSQERKGDIPEQGYVWVD